MHEHPAGRHVVDVIDLDFQIVDGGGRAAGGDVGDARRAGVGAEALAGEELVSADEGFAVFGPERVVDGRADGFFEALDVDVEDVSRRVLERAGDDAAFARRDIRARCNGYDIGVSVDAAFGDGDVNPDYSPLVFSMNGRTIA